MSDSKDAPPAYPAGAKLPTAQPTASSGGGGDPPAYVAQPVTVVYQQQQQLPGFNLGLDYERNQERTVKYLRYIPAFHICPVILFLSINCVIPGIGTMLSCFFLPCGNTVMKGDSMGKILCITFWFGLVQLITCPIVVGYFLAIFWSYGTLFTFRLYYQRQLDESEIQQLVTSA
ncbi:protein SPEC3-like [Sycon ciliatum]|uniref:protein SPEC3-like n=1 Tax=Sycon ciliatum TaxID=27933 RepID=UPI0020AAB329